MATTLQAGLSSTVTVTVPLSYFTVTCVTGDVMRVSWQAPGSSSGIVDVKQVTQDVGPFADNTVVTFTAVTGSPSYDGALSGGLTDAQRAWVQSSVSGDVIVTSRNSQGLVTNYTWGGNTYVVAYNAFGLPATVSGAGQIQTYTYDASGNFVSVATV
jgi:YD repeat-containing protein